MICWNEERLLPLFLNHYQTIARKIIVWDNHSDDSSPDLVRKCPIAELRTYGQTGKSSEHSYLEIKNHCWKERRADWIIVCDVDELIYQPNLLARLRETPHEVLRCDGFNVSGPFLSQTYHLQHWRGSFAPWYCKAAVFRSSLAEINYGIGCHSANPSAPISPSDIRLLHCHYLGTDDDLVSRYRRLAARQPQKDIESGYSSRYRLSDEQIRARFRSVIDASYPFRVIDRVRSLQRDGASWDQLVQWLQSNRISPPWKQCNWSQQSAKHVFGEHP